MEFGKRVLQARKTKGMSQERLAEVLGVSRQAVSKWETGEAKPDVDKLIAICDALQLDMNYLCFGKQEEACKSELRSAENAECGSNNPFQKTRKNVFAAFCMGLVFGLFVTVMGFLVFHEKKQEMDYSEFLRSMTVADVTHDLQFGNGGKYWTVSLVPSMQIEEMQMQYMIVDNIQGTVQYLDAEYADGRYQADWFLREHYDVDFIAVFILDELSVQVPLFQLAGNQEHSSMVTYWNE